MLKRKEIDSDINEEKFAMVNEIKLLSLTIDENLKFETNINLFVRI